MKRNSIFVLISSISLMLSQSCTRDDNGFVQRNSEQVFFSITTGGNDASTKASDDSSSVEQSYQIIYDFLTGEQLTPQNSSSNDSTTLSSSTRYSGSVLTVGSQKIERINWVENDQLSIFQKHSSTSIADYKITSVPESTTRYSKGEIKSISPNPLQWIKGVDNCFVSVYPSLADKGISAANWVIDSGLETTINGGYTYFPNEQICKYDTETSAYQPDMSYAYMLAVKKVSQSSVPMKELQIDFYPDFNAVEFNLIKPSELASNQLIVNSATLTANVAIAMKGPSVTTKIDFPASGRAHTTIVNEGLSGGAVLTEKSITLKFKKGGADFQPELEASTPLKFTFLTLPVNIGELTVDLDMVIDGVPTIRTLKLKNSSGTNISLGKYKKLIISNTSVPGIWEYHLKMGSTKDTTLTSSGEVTIPIDITSYRTGDKGTTKIPVPPSVKFSLDGETFYSLDDPTIPNELKSLFPANPITLQEKDTKDGYTGGVSVAKLRTCREIRTDILRSRSNVSSLPGFGNAKVTTADGDFANLALYDFVADNFRQATQPKTANCYVIRHPGNYAIPVVYGNGLDYTKESSAPYYNTVAYAPARPDGAEASTFLTPFHNYADEGIVDPWIHYDIIKSKDGSMTGDQAAQAFINDYEVVVLWEDVLQGQAFIDASSLKLKTTSVSFGIDGATVVPYITFSTKPLQEGNAVFVIRKKNGDKTIVWSYHIWVSAEEFELSNWTNHNSEITQMLSVPLGFNRDGNNDNGSFYMSLSQDKAPGTGESAPQTIKVNRPVMREDNAPYYQWGRKDPFLPSCGNEEALNIYNNSNKKWHSPAGYQINGRVTSTRASDGATNAHSTLHDTHYDYRTEGFGYPIKNPHDICRTGNVYDWIKGDSHPYNLWFATNHLIGDAAPTTTPVKTIYDPCPPGFVVPRKTFATGFTVSGGARVNVTADPNTPKDLIGLDNLNLVEGKKEFEWGWWFKRNSSDTKGQFFPAFGTRGINGGGLNFVTARAYYQSATLAEQLVPYNFYFYHWWSRDANPTLSSYVVTLYDTPRPSRVLPSTVWPSAE